MRILFVIDGLDNGGKERQLVEIIKEMERKSLFSIGLITFNKDCHYTEIVQDLVYYFVEIDKKNNHFKPFFTIWKYIKQFHPDIIHTWDTLSSFYSWLPTRFWRIKLIDGSIRDAGIEKGWQLLFKKFFLTVADKIISNSLAGLRVYKVNGEVLYNAIDMKRFFKRVDNREFNLIMVANFSEYKDHKTFIDAAAKLKIEKIVDNIFLVGDGPRKPTFISYVNESFFEIRESFFFLGNVSNVESILAQCAVGVLCSTSKYGEGISNSLLEYMASGIIAIGTKVGGITEIVKDNTNGFLINESDSSSIVEIVKRVRSNDELFTRITQNALTTIETKFSYEQNCEKLTRIYMNLCEEK